MPKDATMDWLKRNDPEYANRNKLSNPYLNNRQLDDRHKREIPLSNLGTNYIKNRFDISEEEFIRIKGLMS